MPAETIALRVDEQQFAHIESTAARPPLSFRAPADGTMQYRLLDATGAELYRGRVPGTMPATYHILDMSGLPRTPPGPSSVYHPTVIVPALGAGTPIEFLDGQGKRIGLGAL
jgi:hypothetical protein